MIEILENTLLYFAIVLSCDSVAVIYALFIVKLVKRNTILISLENYREKSAPLIVGTAFVFLINTAMFALGATENLIRWSSISTGLSGIVAILYIFFVRFPSFVKCFGAPVGDSR